MRGLYMGLRTHTRGVLTVEIVVHHEVAAVPNLAGVGPLPWAGVGVPVVLALAVSCISVADVVVIVVIVVWLLVGVVQGAGVPAVSAVPAALCLAQLGRDIVELWARRGQPRVRREWGSCFLSSKGVETKIRGLGGPQSLAEWVGMRNRSRRGAVEAEGGSVVG